MKLVNMNEEQQESFPIGVWHRRRDLCTSRRRRNIMPDPKIPSPDPNRVDIPSPAPGKNAPEIELPPKAPPEMVPPGSDGQSE